MLRPTTGELLRGIRIGLEQSVLPELAAGKAERQLKASLHALRRLERCWDRFSATLAADNADIAATLEQILARLPVEAAPYAARHIWFDEVDPSAPAEGLFTNAEMARLAARNLSLQQRLAGLESALREDRESPASLRIELRSMLSALYKRMLARERYQMGLGEEAGEQPGEIPVPRVESQAPAAAEETLQGLEVVEDALTGTDVVATRVVSIAEGIISITLAAASGRPLPAWSPGAHIDLIFDGKLERQYSLCGTAEDRRHWTVAVLREPESRGGSSWLHGNLRQGDTLRARGPRNNFHLEDAARYLFIAGGVGITPIMGMIREVERRGVPWRLIYGGRRRSSMAFLDELTSLGPRVTVWPQDERGVIDLPATIGTLEHGTAVYCCGPESLLVAVEQYSSTWPEDTLHVERFKPRSGPPAASAGSFELVLAKSGQRLTVPAGQSIAAALEAVGVIVPTSCGEGTCGTCATPVLEGLPDHRDSFLTGRKRRENKTVMACCSRALTPSLVLDL